MPNEINGLPAHILLIHLVIAAIPLAALLLLLSVCWPTARRRLGLVTPIVALAALIAVPITTHAGEWLATQVGRTPLIARHIALGRQLLPWAVGLFVVAAAHWFLTRPAAAGAEGHAAPAGSAGGPTTMVQTRSVSTVVTVVFVVLATVVAVGSVWMVYRIGDSGAQAVWTRSFGN